MKSTINNRIKRLRNSLNLSQQDFSNAAQVSSSLISKIESDVLEPSDDTIIKISQTWKVPMDWLTQGIGEMYFEKKPVNNMNLPLDFDPATDTLYKELKEQIVFYRNLLTQMAGGKSFPLALNGTGLKKRSLGALAA